MFFKRVLLGCLIAVLLLSTTACHRSGETPNYAHLLNPMSGGADAEAEALRQNILNTTDKLEITGTTYYVSENGNDENDGTSPETAWQTLRAVVRNGYLLEPGDAVLFERGYVYRRTTAFQLKSGITYGAYGTGEKPAIYGSAENYALCEWKAGTANNVWELSLPTEEAGVIVFDHGVAVGTPKYDAVLELQENGDFYHDFENGVFYLYLDKGNPADVYTDIEIGTKSIVLSARDGSTDITIDNLAVKYAGLYAIRTGEGTQNTRITNCEIGWVGGCRYSDSQVGLGNGIHFWQDTENTLVENCWIYQCYDAGISPQGIDEAHTYKDVVFRGNLIEFCNYSIEFFDRTSDTAWDGLVIEDNIMRFAGYGFMPASKRPDSQLGVAHLLGWRWNYKELSGNGIIIRNNIFDCSARNLVFWSGKAYETGLTVSGNSFYQKAAEGDLAMHVYDQEQATATNQAELEAAVRAFDPTATVVQWID